MATVPTWFDGNTYMKNKLALLQETDSTMTYNKMLDAFTAAGYIDEPGYYQHFLDYGKHEGVSPNALFDNAQYMQFKAISYFTSDDAGTQKVDEATVRANMQYYAGQIKQAFDDAGMSAWEHYEQYGGKEGINPSNSFDDSNYIDAKVKALADAGVTKEDGSAYTAKDVRQAIADAGMTPLTHFETYKGGEGEVAEDATFTVPADEQVSGSGSSEEGKLFALTAGADTLSPNAVEAKFQTTAGDDTIMMTVADSFDAADYIDGGDGTDTIKGSGIKNGEAPTMTNVEILDYNGATATLDMAHITGLEKVIAEANGTAAVLTLDNAKLTDYQFGGSGSTEGITINAWASGAIASGSTVNIVDNLNGQAATFTGVAGAAITTANLSGTGTSLTLANMDKLTTINANVDNTMTLTAAASTAITSIDASASAGGLNYEAPALASTFTVKGGAGNDVFKLGASAAGYTISSGEGDDVVIGATGKGTVDLGAGKDTFASTAASKATTVTLGAGDDTYVVNDATSSLQATMDTITDFNAAGTDHVAIIAAAANARDDTGTVHTILQGAIDGTGETDVVAALTKLEGALTGLSATTATWFTLGSDTYIYAAKAADTVAAADDVIVKLAGVSASDFNIVEDVLVGVTAVA